MKNARFIRERAEALRSLASPCRLCPRRCGVDRLAGEMGFCRTGSDARIARAVPHMGEEPPLSGTRGAGTIFFSGCHLGCVFCQNHQISRDGLGQAVSVKDLADTMLFIAAKGCHNIELVSATHLLPWVVSALAFAVEKGLDLPVVWNSGGYEAPETLALLEGVVDVYLPDAKYGANERGRRYSGVGDYVDRNLAALDEMVRQTGTGLEIDGEGVARRGIIVRHLVLPGGAEDSIKVLESLRNRYGTELHVAVMSQFFPAYRASRFEELAKGLSMHEYRTVIEAVERLGFENGWIQKAEPPEPTLLPDFSVGCDMML